MATYGRLLVDAGGGVIDSAKQSEKQDGATLIIGLGGTGTSALLKLKKEMYKQLKPDDENAPIPRYDAIKYLVIDTDKSELAKQTGNIYDIDVNNEFIDISNDSIKQTFAATKVLEARKELGWLDYENIHPDDAANGAGGIRAVGRFLLVDKGQMVYDKIKSQMLAALTKAGNGNINVHICAGISGGTGSGTFIDICYLVKAVLAELGKSNARVCGYFFLPDVNLNVPAIAASSLYSDVIRVNGYSALKELDYCMNFGKNHDSFKMNYGFKTIDDHTKPVDLCYLISSTDSSGNVIQNGYQYAMGVVADYILSFLAKVQLPPGAKDNGLTLEGHIANLQTTKESIPLQHGASLDYNILGAAIAEMPLSEIATYLGAKLFEAYADLYDRTPLEKERDDFVIKSQIQYEDLRAQLINGCAPQVVFGKQFDANMYQNNGNKRFIERADEFYNINKGMMEKNFAAITDKLGDYSISQEGTSSISRTFKNLFKQYVVNFDYGPFYAKRMLFGNNNPNLIHAINGMIARNAEDFEAEIRQEKLRKEDLESAKDRMDGAGLLNKGSRIEEYKQALNNWYVHLYRLEAIKRLGDMLEIFKKQLTDLDKEFFAILTTVLDNLRSTFEKNSQILTEGVQEDSTYTWKILSVPDVKDGLDNVIKNLDVNQTLYDLMTRMFDNFKDWIGQDEGEITKLVSKFILEEFKDATNKTMTDYLMEKYNETNPTMLAKRIEQDILEDKLWNKSTPLFWQNSMYKNAYGMHSSMSVPYDAAEIKEAAYNFKDHKGEVTIRESYITDKLSIMRFYSGLPLFAYQAIQTLEEAYEKDTKAGKHLFEKGEVNWRMKLPSPIPESFEITNTPIERIKNRNEELKAQLAKAEEIGVVEKNSLNIWEVKITNDLDMDGITAEYDALKANPDKAACNAFAEKAKGLEAQIATPVKTISLESGKVNAGAERQVMQDFYLLSPELNGIVKKEMDKKNFVADIIVKAEELGDLLGKEKKAFSEFCNAVFAGTIRYGKKVVYSYSEFNVDKTVELMNMDMKYSDAGLYQAFLTYQELDDKLKERIIKESKAAIQDDDSTQLNESIANLDEVMPKKINAALMQYEDEPILPEIESFFKDFMKNLESFKQMYM